jgi:outer membrane lipoprotein-sorting protein
MRCQAALEGNKIIISKRDDNKYLITLASDTFVRKYWVDPKKFVVTDFHLYNGDSLFVKQEFRKFSKERGVMLPKIIRINNPGGHQRVTVFYTDRKTNSRLKSKDFYIKIPKQVKVINL